MSEIKIGDVVKLKSGGPLMTVSYLGDSGGVTCYWFNQTGHEFEAKWAEFKPAMLTVKSS